MLNLNNNLFAKNDKEFINTLFMKRDSTALGYYRVMKNGIKLMDHQKQPIMFIVNNRHGEQFIVSCKKLDNGKTLYSYALSSSDEELIGFDKLGYREQIEATKQAIESIN